MAVEFWITLPSEQSDRQLGWHCSALAVPGATIQEFRMGGETIPLERLKFDSSYIRFVESTLEARDAAAKIRLDKRLVTFDSAVIVAIIGLVGILGSAYLAYITGKKESAPAQVTVAKGPDTENSTIVLFGENSAPLDGQTIYAKIGKDNKGEALSFSYSLKNTGTTAVSPPTGVLYLPDGLSPGPHPSRSPDEPEYKSQLVSKPVNGDDLLPQLSLPYTLTFYPDPMPKPGTYPVLFKLFYGNGRVAMARFRIIVPVAQQGAPADTRRPAGSGRG